MKAKFIIALIAVVLMAMPVFSQDAGEVDSMFLQASVTPDLVAGDSLLALDLYLWNDANDLAGVSAGFTWDFPGLKLDSAALTTTGATAFNYPLQFYYYKNSLDSSNAYRLFQLSATRLSGDGLPQSSVAKHVATFYFHVEAMTYQTDAITFDTIQFGGTYFQFTPLPGSAYFVAYRELAPIMDASDVDPSNNNLPKEFALNQNYPNPFNPATTVEYAVPIASHIDVSVFNVLGQKVTTLVNEDKAAGIYDVQWDTQKSNAASGIYFYRLTADDKVLDTKKMMLLK